MYIYLCSDYPGNPAKIKYSMCNKGTFRYHLKFIPNIKRAFNDLCNCFRFRQQAKDLSERFRDRPLPPLDTAIYWVEYVARHKGAPHMRTAAVNMPFYQYYLLDVISFLLLVVGSVLYTLFYVGRLLLRKLLKHNAKQKPE